ncbi:MAG TPA: lamin tail domain-containing protein [Myxococcota bacterium]|nr:lamin tail domain-containing protein [Myxococcota bacterium]
MIALLLACTENNFARVYQDDFFQQERINTVDVLLVVDNSCSMVEEQNKLATNFDSFIQFFTEADVDWQIGVVTTDVVQEQFAGRLIGGDDEILVVDAVGTVVGEVRYDRDWPVAPGAVFTLDPSYNAAIRNDTLSAWCVGGAGSPGEANTTCATEQGLGTDARYGAVIVTEFLPDPDGVADNLGEWLELTNISDADVDLTGWTLRDNGLSLYSFPEGTILAAGGILTLARTDDSAANGGIEGALALGDGYTLNNHDLYLTRATEGAAEIFSENVAQGTGGVGIEMGFESVHKALIDPDFAPLNAGFVREDANLSVIMVSDEEDSSPMSVNEYLQAFADLKGGEAYRNHARMNVSAVVGDTPPEFDGEPSCSSASGVADYGSRYVYAARATSGLIDSICNDDFSPIVAQLGLTLSGLLVEFELSRVPELDTLVVSIYDSPDEASKVRDLVIDVDFSYVEERNTIVFEADQVPESEQYVKATYRIRSGT